MNNLELDTPTKNYDAKRSTRADDKILGFEYQFYYFLLELLRIGKDELVGFEVKDDVHIESNKYLILLQLKHTRQTTAQGLPKNLTTSDTDLWKTLSNWIDFIKKEQEDNRSDFIQNTHFVFVTNKLEDNNKFVNALKEYNIKKNIIDFKNFITTYSDDLQSNNPNKDYAKKILDLKDDDLELFLLNLKFVFGLDDIVLEIEKEIQLGKSIKEVHVKEIFHSLTGLLKEDFFKKVKNKDNFEFTGEDFYLKTIAIFSRTRSDRLLFNKLSSQDYKDKKVLNYNFAKQLIDISISEENIYEYDYNRLLMEENLKRFQQNGEITDNDIDLLNENTVESWKDEFDEIYLDNSAKTDNNAKKLFIKTLKKDLDLCGQKIEMKKAIKGQFIQMSENYKIGWKFTWKDDYKSEI